MNINMKELFDKFDHIIENMSDNEFDQLLIRSGIEKCPVEENFNFNLKFSASKKQVYVVPKQYSNEYSRNIKVA